MTIKDNILKSLLNVHRKIGEFPFENTFIKIYHMLQKKQGIVLKKIEGIYYELDLSELIDNKIYYGNWEPKTTAMFKRIVKPGMVCLDIGANVGYYTLLSARIMNNTGHVIAFEPTSECFKKLKKNISLNALYNITSERIALANENKITKAKIRSSWKMEGLEEPIEQEIKTIKLDDYIKQNNIHKISFIKIDVDGYEYEVLKGAREMIKEDKPFICIELGHYERYTLDEAITFFRSLGYSFHKENGDRFNTNQEVKDYIPKDGTENFLLLPFNND